MSKVALFIDFNGFIMLFWQSVVRPTRKLENGGGTATAPADEEFQMEKALKWIPSRSIRLILANHRLAVEAENPAQLL